MNQDYLQAETDPPDEAETLRCPNCGGEVPLLYSCGFCGMRLCRGCTYFHLVKAHGPAVLAACTYEIYPRTREDRRADRADAQYHKED